MNFPGDIDFRCYVMLANFNFKKILISKSDYENLFRIVRINGEERLEVGRPLVGQILSNGVCKITHVVEPGSDSKSGSVSYELDTTRVQEQLKLLREEDSSLRYVIDVHSHPWNFPPHPSQTDINQLFNARKTCPWFTIGIFSLNELKFFGIEQGEILEIEFQIIPDDFQEESLLSRINKITHHEQLEKKRIAVLGCGSLGQAVIQGLANSGIRDFLLADMDQLSLENIVRHQGGIYDIGKSKVKILKKYIEEHNPLSFVNTIDDDLLKNRELLMQIIQSYDVIVASSGNPDLNYQINNLCVKLRKPCVFGGIYDKAEKSYVFVYKGSRRSCCFDCIFDLSTTIVSSDTIQRRYGLVNGELHEAQGMISDINVVGCLMTKFVLDVLMKKQIDYNLIMYYSDPSLKRLKITKKKKCPTCDYYNWFKAELKKLQQIKQEKQVIKNE